MPITTVLWKPGSVSVFLCVWVWGCEWLRVRLDVFQKDLHVLPISTRDQKEDWRVLIWLIHVCFISTQALTCVVYQSFDVCQTSGYTLMCVYTYVLHTYVLHTYTITYSEVCRRHAVYARMCHILPWVTPQICPLFVPVLQQQELHTATRSRC